MSKRHSWFWLAFGLVVILASAFPASILAESFKLQAGIPQGPVNSVWEFYETKANPERIKGAIKVATGHDVEIVVHTQLVQAADALDAVRDGRVDIGLQVTMTRADIALMQCLSLPVIIPYEDCPRIQSKLEPIFERELREKFDVEMLAMGYLPRQLLIAKRPAATFAELKGLKFRTHSYDLLELMRKAGGAPVQMPYLEAYLALQRGAIDGAVSSLSGMAGQKWHEVAKHVSWWPLGNATYFLIANKKAWSKLPVNVQRAIKGILTNAGRETWLMSDLEDEKTKEVFTKEYGCTHHFPAKSEVDQLKKMVDPVIKDWKKRAGPHAEEVMAAFNEVLGTKY